MRSAIRGAIAALVIASPSMPTHAQVPVVDGNHKQERERDESSSAASKELKDDEVVNRSSTSCNISRREKGRRLSRTPAQAVQEEGGNVALIKHYAAKYNVPLGLALSVAHAESGIDTCAGSPTGVKGVMQLTKTTGRGLGFDRDINEENIAGGVKYLGMGVQRCGAYNYSCLASFYNGSTQAEQSGWAAKVGRNHTWFNSYAGSGNIPNVTPSAFNSAVDYGDEPVGAAARGGDAAVNSSRDALDANSQRTTQIGALIDALAGGVGTSAVYQDAWDENTRARQVNIDLINELVKSANELNKIIAARKNIENVQASNTSRSMAVDGTINPFACDPALLRRMRIPADKWRKCAAIVKTSSGHSVAFASGQVITVGN